MLKNECLTWSLILVSVYDEECCVWILMMRDRPAHSAAGGSWCPCIVTFFNWLFWLKVFVFLKSLLVWVTLPGWVRHSSHKSSTTHCYFHVSKQCLGFLKLFGLSFHNAAAKALFSIDHFFFFKQTCSKFTADSSIGYFLWSKNKWLKAFMCLTQSRYDD